MGTHPIFESDFDCLTEFTKSKQSWVHAVHQISMVWFHSRSTICLIEHRPKHFDASSSDMVKSVMPTCHGIAILETRAVSVLSVSLTNATRPMPSRAWMATSSTGAISALTTHATSDPTLCRAVGIEAAAGAADHDPDPEADDHALDQVVVVDHDEAALDHALAHHVAVLDHAQHADPEADQTTAAAPDHRLTKSPNHDPDPGQSRALDHDRTEDDTLFILLSQTHILFKVICQLIRKCISFLRVSKKKQNCPT